MYFLLSTPDVERVTIRHCVSMTSFPRAELVIVSSEPCAAVWTAQEIEIHPVTRPAPTTHTSFSRYPFPQLSFFYLQDRHVLGRVFCARIRGSRMSRNSDGNIVGPGFEISVSFRDGRIFFFDTPLSRSVCQCTSLFFFSATVPFSAARSRASWLPVVSALAKPSPGALARP